MLHTQVPGEFEETGFRPQELHRTLQPPVEGTDAPAELRIFDHGLWEPRASFGEPLASDIQGAIGPWPMIHRLTGMGCFRLQQNDASRRRAMVRALVLEGLATLFHRREHIALVSMASEAVVLEPRPEDLHAGEPGRHPEAGLVKAHGSILEETQRNAES